MTTVTLSDGLKAIFGTSQSATTIASTNLMPFMASNGDPVGLTGMANLASVLGEVACFATTTDPDSVTSVGLYQTQNWNTAHAPAANGILIVPFFSSAFWKFQLFIQRSPVDALYYRSGTSTSYSTWHKLAEL